jgi:[acyl-carrier-protein] S-malonyltransferase
MVVLDAVERLGVDAAVLAGHSLGEYSALCASGAVSYEDATRLVAERGDAMRLAGEEHEGTMAAVLGLDDDKVEIACQRTGEDVWVANYNAPGQVVIAGSPAGIEAASTLVKELGAKRVLSVAVSGAFHTPYMAPARDRLRKAIAAAEIRQAETPVYANVDAQPHTSGDEWTGLLAAQLSSPVRWRQLLYNAADAGVTTFVELGPGTVLTGMAKRTVSGARTTSVATPDDLDRLLEAVSAVPTTEAGHEGEHLFATERLVVSPAAGVFTPAGPTPDAGDAEVGVGDVLGKVGEHEVRSQFRGWLMELLAVPGERVTQSQPIAWLRVG